MNRGLVSVPRELKGTICTGQGHSSTGTIEGPPLVRHANHEKKSYKHMEHPERPHYCYCCATFQILGHHQTMLGGTFLLEPAHQQVSVMLLAPTLFFSQNNSSLVGAQLQHQKQPNTQPYTFFPTLRTTTTTNPQPNQPYATF